MLIIVSAGAFAVTITYGSGVDSGTRDIFGKYLAGAGSTGTENFQDNDLVQLIWVGSNGMMDSI